MMADRGWRIVPARGGGYVVTDESGTYRTSAYSRPVAEACMALLTSDDSRVLINRPMALAWALGTAILARAKGAAAVGAEPVRVKSGTPGVGWWVLPRHEQGDLVVTPSVDQCGVWVITHRWSGSWLGDAGRKLADAIILCDRLAAAADWTLPTDVIAASPAHFGAADAILDRTQEVR